MTTTIETVTDAQIESLRNAAGSAGDSIMVEMCNVALDGKVSDESYEMLTHVERNRVIRMTQTEARIACVDAISDAEGRNA